jgi:hypothetical protein
MLYNVRKTLEYSPKHGLKLPIPCKGAMVTITKYAGLKAGKIYFRWRAVTLPRLGKVLTPPGFFSIEIIFSNYLGVGAPGIFPLANMR